MTAATGARPGGSTGRDAALVAAASVLVALLALALAPLGVTVLYGAAGLTAAGVALWSLRAEVMPPVRAAVARVLPHPVAGRRPMPRRASVAVALTVAVGVGLSGLVLGDRAMLVLAATGLLLAVVALAALCWPLVVDLVTRPPEDVPDRPRRGPRVAPVLTGRARLLAAVVAIAAIGPLAVVLAGLGPKILIAAAGLAVVATLAVVVRDRSVCFTLLTAASLAVVLHKSLGPQDIELSGGAISVYVTTFDAMVVLLYAFWIREGTFLRDLGEGLRRPVVWLPLLGALFLLPSLLVVESPWHAAGELVRMGWMYLLYVYVAVRVRTRRHVWAVLAGLAVFAAFELVVVLGQAYTGGNLGLSILGIPAELTQRIAGGGALGRPFGTIIHPVFMGAALGSLLLVALSLAIHLERSLTKIVAAVFVGICGLPLYLAHARASVLAVALAGLYVIGTGLARRRLAWSTIGRLALVGGAVGVALLPELMRKFSENFFTAHFWEEVDSRLQLNALAVDMWHDHWLLGVGLNNFELVLPRYSENFVIFFGNPVHNLFLLYLSETGAIGLLGVLLVGGVVLHAAVRAARSTDRLLGGTAIGVVAVTVFLVLEEQLGFSLRQDVPLAVYWLLAGLAVACGRMASTGRPAAPGGPPVPPGPGGERFLPVRRHAAVSAGRRAGPPSAPGRSTTGGTARPGAGGTRPLHRARRPHRPAWVAGVVLALAVPLLHVPAASSAVQPTAPEDPPATDAAAGPTAPSDQTAAASPSVGTDAAAPSSAAPTGEVGEPSPGAASPSAGTDAAAPSSAAPTGGAEEPSSSAASPSGSAADAAPPDAAPTAPPASRPDAAPAPSSSEATAARPEGIVFGAVVRATGRAAIFTAAPDGSGIRQITPDDGRHYTWPRWAFGNRKIVYAVRDREPKDGPTDLAIMDADGSNARIISSFDYAVGQPRVDSTGRWLYFTAAPPWFPDNAVFRMDLLTLESRNLTGIGSPLGGLDADPALGPDESTLYLIAGSDDHADVVRMSVEGTDRVTITDGQHWNTDPDVSPDGATLAISSYRGPETPSQGRLDARPVDFHLVLHDLATGTERILTQGAGCAFRSPVQPCSVEQMSAYAPKFTPDGSRIAFTGALDRATTCVCLIGTDGSAAAVLIRSTELAIGWFDFPRQDTAGDWAQIGSRQRGTRLLVTMAGGDGKDVALVDASPDLMHRTVLDLPAGLEPTQARWSPDRTRVVFTARVRSPATARAPHPAPPPRHSRREHVTLADLDPVTYATRQPPPDTDQGMQVFLREADGSVRALTDPWIEDWRDGVREGDARSNSDPVFSADGEAVIVTNTSTLTGESFLLRIDLTTGAVLNLTNATSGALPVDDRAAAVSPDGRRLAFTWTEGSYTDVWTMRPDGSDVRPVTATDASDGQPAWLPDGSAVLSVQGHGASTVLVRTDLRDGRRTRLLGPAGGPLGRPVAAPEGDRVLVLGTWATNRTAFAAAPTGGADPVVLQPDPVHQYLDLDWR